MPAVTRKRARDLSSQQGDSKRPRVEDTRRGSSAAPPPPDALSSPSPRGRERSPGPRRLGKLPVGTEPDREAEMLDRLVNSQITDDILPIERRRRFDALMAPKGSTTDSIADLASDDDRHSLYAMVAGTLHLLSNPPLVWAIHSLVCRLEERRVPEEARARTWQEAGPTNVGFGIVRTMYRDRPDVQAAHLETLAAFLLDDDANGDIRAFLSAVENIAPARRSDLLQSVADAAGQGRDGLIAREAGLMEAARRQLEAGDATVAQVRRALCISYAPHVQTLEDQAAGASPHSASE